MLHFGHGVCVGLCKLILLTEWNLWHAVCYIKTSSSEEESSEDEDEKKEKTKKVEFCVLIAFRTRSTRYKISELIMINPLIPTVAICSTIARRNGLSLPISFYSTKNFIQIDWCFSDLCKKQKFRFSGIGYMYKKHINWMLNAAQILNSSINRTLPTCVIPQ